MAMFMWQRSQGVYIGGALMNQPLSTAEHRCMRLLVTRFGLHAAHHGLACCDDDPLGIGSIILLALHERAQVLRRDQFHFVPKWFHCKLAVTAVCFE